MSREERLESDTLEIAELEYDVGGMGSEEPAESQVSMEGFLVVCVIPK
jgi:hypothetical protein